MTSDQRATVENLEKFFVSYVAAFNSRDASRTAEHVYTPCFDLHVVDGRPGQSIFASSAEMAAHFQDQIDRISELGWAGTSRVLRTRITLLTERTASILADFERRTTDGAFIEGGRVIYYLLNEAGDWKISGYAHVAEGYPRPDDAGG